MGTPLLTPATAIFSPTQTNFPARSGVAALLPGRADPEPDAAARFEPRRQEAGVATYSSSAYRSLQFRQSVSLRLSGAQVQLGSGGDGGDPAAVGFQANQLQFDFFQETRYEELVLFQQRTAATGDQLDGVRQSHFFATRQEIATRFEVSLSISGAALDGFATTAEGAAGSGEFIDRLLAAAQELLSQAEELFDGFFAQLSGGDREFSAQSLNELFDEFVTSFLAGFGRDAGARPAIASGVGNGGASNAGDAGVQAGATQLEFNFEFAATVTATQVTVEQGDPLVLDLDGDGIELTDYRNGARFDLLGNGRAQQVAFVHGGDAFLALDRNGDGQINSGLELFGEQHGARNGFEELRRFDGNRDGLIDRNDAVFNDLRLFRDNGNGVTEAGELFSLLAGGVSAIDLGYEEVDERAAGGNRIAQVASYIRDDGSRGRAADALLNYIA